MEDVVMVINRNVLSSLIVLGGVLLLTGCTAGPNTAVHTYAADGTVAGFWLGLWHGLISPITFIISLLQNDVHFYEVHNNGGWYNLGFILGIASTFEGSHTTVSKKGSK